jgi:hypothetical protein
MQPRYALVGAVTGDLLTYQGRVLLHPDRAELEWLFPLSRVVRVTGDVGPTLALSAHPDMYGVSFPLDRRDFR